MPTSWITKPTQTHLKFPYFISTNFKIHRVNQFQCTVIALWLLLLFSVSLEAQSGRCFFIKPEGRGDGSSWANASGDLPATLEKSSSGDVVWVAAGKYLPSVKGDRRASFVIREGVQLYGGFAGYETQLKARNIPKNPTVLSGNIGDVNSAADNSYTVVRFHSASPTTILDGFRIRDGRANGQTEKVGPSSCGGGIFLDAASPTIRNCVLKENLALHGGGMYVYARRTKSTPSLQSCTFQNNRAELYGGGICNDGGQGDCAPVLAGCRFIDNQALYGAGIANQVREGSCTVRLRDCHFQGNFADLRGGAILNKPTDSDQGKVLFEACSFSGNTSTIGREADEKPYKSGRGTLVF